MTEQADQLHHHNAPAHSTALVQAFFGKASHHPGLSAPPTTQIRLPATSDFSKLKSPLKGRRFVSVTDTQYINSVNSVSLPTD